MHGPAMRQAFVQQMAVRQQVVDFDFINHKKDVQLLRSTQEQVLKLAGITTFISLAQAGLMLLELHRLT